MSTLDIQRFSRILGLGVAGCLVLSLTAPIPAGAQRPLRMAHEGDAVAVSDLAPGAEVVALVVSRSARDFVPFNERRDETRIDDDGDGVVRIPLAAPVPPKTVVIAVELASGRFDIWMPEDSPGREVALPPQALTQGPGNGFERLEYRGSYVELFMVRAGVGAWGLTTGDGTAADESPSVERRHGGDAAAVDGAAERERGSARDLRGRRPALRRVADRHGVLRGPDPAVTRRERRGDSPCTAPQFDGSSASA